MKAKTNQPKACRHDAILGREAAERHGTLTMEALLKEDKRLEVDLKGLQA